MAAKQIRHFGIVRCHQQQGTAQRQGLRQLARNVVFVTGCGDDHRQTAAPKQPAAVPPAELPHIFQQFRLAGGLGLGAGESAIIAGIGEPENRATGFPPQRGQRQKDRFQRAAVGKGTGVAHVMHGCRLLPARRQAGGVGNEKGAPGAAGLHHPAQGAGGGKGQSRLGETA